MGESVGRGFRGGCGASAARGRLMITALMRWSNGCYTMLLFPSCCGGMRATPPPEWMLRRDSGRTVFGCLISRWYALFLPGHPPISQPP